MTTSNVSKGRVGWFFYDPENKTVLLHRRDHRASEQKNSWDCFGGTVEQEDASLLDALIREVEEELGIKFKKSDAIPLLVRDGNQHIYFFHFSDDKEHVRRIVLGEGAGFAWLSVKDALALRGLAGEAEEILRAFQKTI